MAIQITTKENQASGVFAGGAILENKPIGFPQDGGEQKPFSNLFYWANAWSDKGGLIDEHPHKMFEIMSFVLEGEIEHYDSKLNGWLTLKAGDVQIIRSRGGITHAERLLENSRIFQIWFDPNIRESMLKEATYDDYKSEDLLPIEENGVSTNNYVGNGGPVQMDSEGVEVSEVTFQKGNQQLILDKDRIYSFYLLKGKVSIDGRALLEHDFIKVEDQNQLELDVNSETRIFQISVQKKLTYKTYTELVKY
jgi:redox-sensitive bicupin YhaK (pirin superfamily)